MHAWSLYLKKAYNDQDKLKYNIDVKFGHIIKMKRSLEWFGTRMKYNDWP